MAQLRKVERSSIRSPIRPARKLARAVINRLGARVAIIAWQHLPTMLNGDCSNARVGVAKQQKERRMSHHNQDSLFLASLMVACLVAMILGCVHHANHVDRVCSATRNVALCDLSIQAGYSDAVAVARANGESI